MSKLFKRTQVVASLLGIWTLVAAMARRASPLMASDWRGLSAANIREVLMPFVVPTLVIAGLLYWLGWVSAQSPRETPAGTMSDKSKGMWSLGALGGVLFTRLAMSLVLGSSIRPVMMNGLAVVAGVLSGALTAWGFGRFGRSSAEPPAGR